MKKLYFLMMLMKKKEEIIFLDDADEEEVSQEEEQQLSNTDTDQDISVTTTAAPAVYFCLPKEQPLYHCDHRVNYFIFTYHCDHRVNYFIFTPPRCRRFVSVFIPYLTLSSLLHLFSSIIPSRLDEEIIFHDDVDEEKVSQEEEQQLSNTDTEQDISVTTTAIPAVYFCLRQRTAALSLRPPSELLYIYP
ncbi:hypothetical protein QE152_g6372 [Popillia japonica]|uniref:Uncharacterized protein n=1 Tax=Popillia japonica TaxID=7064 RepID=A0AAW1MII7_POPJA